MRFLLWLLSECSGGGEGTPEVLALEPRAAPACGSAPAGPNVELGICEMFAEPRVPGGQAVPGVGCGGSASASDGTSSRGVFNNGSAAPGAAAASMFLRWAPLEGAVGSRHRS